MVKPIIRSITIFTGKPRDWSNVEEVSSIIGKAMEKAMKAEDELRGRGYEVWTKRITLPTIPPTHYNLIPGIIDQLRSYTDQVLINIGGLYLEKINLELLEYIVSNNVYTGILWNNGFQLDKIIHLIHGLSGLNPVYNTRIAVSLLGEPLETPYYPLSTSIHGWGIGIALLYPRAMLKAFDEEGLDGVIKLVSSTHKHLVEIFGDDNRLIIDHSISPWMENSVAELIEVITGDKPGEPGFIEGIDILNNVLRTALRNEEFIGGFNEVMLPYAEDKLLIETGGRGEIRARDFLLYSTICVAGPDMLVVPMDYDRLRSFIKASHVIANRLSKRIALRIIPVDGKPGDRVKLGKFGNVYVIDY